MIVCKVFILKDRIFQSIPDKGVIVVRGEQPTWESIRPFGGAGTAIKRTCLSPLRGLIVCPRDPRLGRLRKKSFLSKSRHLSG